MQIITVLHEGIANMVWMFFLVLGAWGLFRAIRGEGIDGNYIGAVYIGQGLFVAQGIIGAILWFNGLDVALARPGIHALYGIFVLIFLPFIYFFFAVKNVSITLEQTFLDIVIDRQTNGLNLHADY